MKARGILPMEKKELKKKIETTYLDIAIPSNVLYYNFIKITMIELFGLMMKLQP